MTEVLLSERAADRLNDIDPEIRDRITEALRSVDPDRELERLSGSESYKLRVGDYRVIVDWDREAETLYVLTLGGRRNIYDREL
jgi:mRNA interferase RelE/StbE